MQMGLLNPVYTVPDPYGHDIKLKSWKTSVTHEFMTILENFITTIHRRSGKSKYDLKLTELDVVTTRIRYRVNRALDDSIGAGKNSLVVKCKSLIVHSDLIKPGFFVNKDRSNWVPTQVIIWLGYAMDTHSNTIYLLKGGFVNVFAALMNYLILTRVIPVKPLWLGRLSST